jgi:hypothetical protein
MVDPSVKGPTHTAFTLKREGRKFGRWLEIGNARLENDGSVRISLDRLPVGGFTGIVQLTPIGMEPPAPPQPEPQRPAAAVAAADDDENLD